jgi:hypothetical protein
MDSTFTKSQILALLGLFFVLVLAMQWYTVRTWSSPTPTVSSVAPFATTSSDGAPALAGKAVSMPFGTGKIVSISSEGVTVQLQAPFAFQLKLTISQTTKIQEGAPIPPTESAALMQDYVRKYVKDGFGVPLPELFTSTKMISFSSLRAGDNVLFFLMGAVNSDSKTAPAASITRVLK